MFSRLHRGASRYSGSVRRTTALVIAGAALVFGCRAVLGIEDRPPIDAAVNDAGALLETGPGADGEGGSPFCKTTMPPPGFCDDFDDLPFEAKWDNAGTVPDVGTGGGGTITPDTVSYRSSPRSAKMSIPALIASSTNGVAILVTTVPMGLRELDVQADVLIGTEFFPSDEGSVTVLGLTFVGGAGVSVEVRRDRLGTFLFVDNVRGELLWQPFPVGTWKTLELRFEFDTSGGPSGQLHTYIDGAASGTASLPRGFYAADRYPRVVVGALAVGPMAEFRLNVDNVAVRGTR